MYLVSSRPRFFRLLGAMIVFAILTGCAYNKAVNNLSPEERNVFRAYRKVMKRSQAVAYLSKPNPAEREAYLREIGALQRFEALDPLDRESIQNGYIRKGMSSEALNFLWGRPQYTVGTTGEWEEWVYNGQIGDLFEHGNSLSDAGTNVRVRLINSQVEWWFVDIPDINEDSGENFLKGSLLFGRFPKAHHGPRW